MKSSVPSWPRLARPLACVASLSTAGLVAEPGSGTGQVRLSELSHPSPKVRIAALRDLQTSLDPRIPEAMIPLLADEGTSIRRLAARAIGNRALETRLMALAIHFGRLIREGAVGSYSDPHSPRPADPSLRLDEKMDSSQFSRE